MKRSKKSMAALLLTAALVTSGLVGCSQTADSASTTKDTTTTSSESSNVPLNNNQPQSNGGSQTGQQQQQDQSQQMSDPNAKDPAIQAVAKAFNIGSDYYALTADSIVAVALGHVELPLDQKQRLTLAKAMNAAMQGSGWKQGDPTPGLFVARDGSSFDLGMKLPNGDLTLQTFQLQQDKTYQRVKVDTKKGS